MLLDEIKNIKSSKQDLKKFGLTLGVCFTLIGAVLFWKSKPVYPYWLGLSVFFNVFAFWAPLVLKPIQKVWMILAFLMGWVMTRVLLSVVFYGVITPMSFIARLAGKKFLRNQSSGDGSSYWIARQPLDRKKEDYEKQY